MALKAGRVGVNPADVDPIDGHISPSSVDSYTKTEADAKFETQEAAAALQPKTLAVPISMLQGSLLVPKTTVEDVIQTMNNAMTNAELTDAVIVKDGTITFSKGTDQSSVLKKQGSMVFANIRVSGVTATDTEVIATLPVGYRPSSSINNILYDINAGTSYRGYIDSDGTFRCGSALSNASIRFVAVYLV